MTELMSLVAMSVGHMVISDFRFVCYGHVHASVLLSQTTFWYAQCPLHSYFSPILAVSVHFIYLGDVVRVSAFTI